MLLFKEVALINKQKFLAELGKLLTFMYEEDRQTALKMYSDMFDAAGDEHALLQYLVSPTRQAVAVARAYNAKERKLQVHSQSKNDDGLEDDPDETPDFVLAIGKIAVNAALISYEAPDEAEEDPETNGEHEIPEGQFSLFADDPESVPDIVFEPAEKAPEEAAEEPVPAPEAPAEAQPNLQQAGQAAEPETSKGEQVSEEAEAAEPAEVPAEAASEAEPQKDAVDEFIENFSFVETQPENTQADAQPAAEEKADCVPVEEEDGEPLFVLGEQETVRRPRVALLILFIIFAIPITLIGVALLLVPTLVSLAVALVFIVFGSGTLIAAFAGFAVFADILVMLGAALILLALGLLFIWIFIWFIGGAIVGLIKGVVALGGRWCYKEVPTV